MTTIDCPNCEMTADGKHALDCSLLDDSPTLPDLPKSGEQLEVALVLSASLKDSSLEETTKVMQNLKEIMLELFSKKDCSKVSVNYTVVTVSDIL